MNSQPPDRPNSPDSNPPKVPASKISGGNRSGSIPSRSISGLWLGVNALGFAISITILGLMSISANSAPQQFASIVPMSASGILLGSCVGALQAAILKRKLFGLRIWQWILASIAAIYLGLLGGVIVWSTVIAVFPTAIRFSLLSFSIFGAMLGMSVGLGQVLVLARRVRGLRRWWFANVVGRSLGWLAAEEVRQLLSNRQGFLLADSLIETVAIALLYGCTIGLVYGSVTALALPSLTPRQRSTVDDPA